MKYYRLNRVLEKNAVYNIIFGERSNGKSYAVWEYAIERYTKYGEQLAVIRRETEDFKGKRAGKMCEGLVENGVIKKLTHNEWSGVFYKSMQWYFCRYDYKNERIVSDEPFAYGFSLSAMEHDKSTSFPKVTTILFDEFITRYGYLNDEFVLLMNVISTIVRERNNVKIFMLGNTVNKYCPYFDEMGLKHIEKMKPGDIDIYQYGDTRLTVAVEYTSGNKSGKESDFYFAFDNPKLQMITTGAWEIDIYPHCPVKYKPHDVIFRYFIKFDGHLLQCNIVVVNGYAFTFVHEKTTDLQNPDKDIIYSTEYDYRPNHRRNIKKPIDKIGTKIYSFFQNNKIFYQSNEIGEIMRNYLLWCSSN